MQANTPPQDQPNSKLEQIISGLEWRFAVAMIKSREDGDPKHRKKVIADAVKAIKEQK